jgi:putative redox protein
MKIITRKLSDEVYEAENENGKKVRVDTRAPDKREDQSPTELLLSALAGCGAVDIVVMLKKRRKRITNFIIETTGTRNEEPPRYFTKIHCHYIITSPDATEEESIKVARLALDKYCSVAASLKSEITFSVQINRS